MNVLRSFTRNSLKNHKKWTVVTILGVIIATAMITAVATIISSFVSFIIAETVADTGEWHAVYFQVEKQNVPIIRADSTTGALMQRRTLGFAPVAGGRNANKPYWFVNEFDDNALAGFPIRLVEGRLPQTDAELLVPQHMETNGGVKFNLGDSVTLNIGKRLSNEDGEALTQNDSFRNGRDDKGETFVPQMQKTYTVVGVFERPGFESRFSPGYTAITRLNPDALAPADKVDVYITMAKLTGKVYDETHAVGQKAGVSEDRVGYNAELLRYYGIAKNDKFMNIFYVLGGIFSAIIMIASIALIYNAFSISVSERISQLGMLASVGATRRQKRATVYLEGLFVGIVGIPLGIVAGIAGIGVTLRLISPLMMSTMPDPHSSLHLVLSSPMVILAAGLAALTIFLSVYVPARRASRVMPIDAIRQTKEVKMTAKTIKTSKLTRILFGFEGELALKNLKRSRGKYRATVVSLVISLLLFLSVASIAKDMRTAADMRLDIQRVNFDAYLTIHTTDSAVVHNVYDEISQLKTVGEHGIGRLMEVNSYLPQSRMPKEAAAEQPLPIIDGNAEFKATVMALDAATFDTFVHQIGSNADYRDASTPRAILINRSVGYSTTKKRYFDSSALVAQAGDVLNLTQSNPADGAEPNKTTVNLGAVTDELPLGGAVLPYGSYLIVTTDEVYAKLQEQLGETGEPDTLVLRSPDPEKLDTQIEAILREYDVMDYKMANVAVDAKQEQRILTVMGVFLYGFIALISLICVANIFNTVSTNIGLRRKEFAMLRSVGMTEHGFNKMLNFESVFYGLNALLIGLPLSAAVAYLLYCVINKEFDYAFSLPYKDYAIAIAAVFCIVGATMLYSGSRLKKQNIIDALKDESL